VPIRAYPPVVAGYAASGRLQGVVPRFAGADPGFGAAAWTLPAGTVEPADAAAIVQVELVGRPLDEVIRDWLASIGESWSQLTFFLFDPESWR
jgi:hypothetical protein